MTKICRDCINYDECYFRNSNECDDYVSEEEFFEENRVEYRADFYSYLNEFENC